MKKLSVIVPIYNTDQYLERCLNSICNQTYTNIEIICVNDGSTDGCQEIVDKFAKRDSRIIAIQKVNGGVGSARNTGLKASTGSYIGFCDSDDWLELTMYEKLINIMDEKNVDLVATNYFYDSGEQSLMMENKFEISEKVFGRNELFNYTFMRDYYKGFSAYIWCKVFRRELLFLEDKLLLFDENLKIGEDVLYFAQIAIRVVTAIYESTAYYHYYQRSDSVMHAKEISTRNDQLTAYEKIIELVEAEGFETDIHMWIKRFLAYHSMNSALIAYEQNNKEALKVFQEAMQKYRYEYIEKNLYNKDRISQFLDVMDLKLV